MVKYTPHHKSDGTVVTAGTNPLDNNYDEHAVSDWTDIVGIAAGNMTTIGLKSDGTVVAVGYEVDYLNQWTNVIYVNEDSNIHMGIRPDGRVYGFSDIDLF